LTRLSSLTQIIVNITRLDAISVVTDILKFLEEIKKGSSKRETNSSKCEEKVNEKFKRACSNGEKL
jgi:hypothetical protein